MKARAHLEPDPKVLFTAGCTRKATYGRGRLDKGVQLITHAITFGRCGQGWGALDKIRWQTPHIFSRWKRENVLDLPNGACRSFVD